jgi:hypothetical protein
VSPAGLPSSSKRAVWGHDTTEGAETARLVKERKEDAAKRNDEQKISYPAPITPLDLTLAKSSWIKYTDENQKSIYWNQELRALLTELPPIFNGDDRGLMETLVPEKLLELFAAKAKIKEVKRLPTIQRGINSL